MLSLSSPMRQTPDIRGGDGGGSGGSVGRRNYWENPREQARRKARSDIRERVRRGYQQERNNEGEPGLSGPPQDAEAGEPVDEEEPRAEQTSMEQTLDPEEVRETVVAVLRRILNDDKAFFSLQSLQKHWKILNAAWPTKFLWAATPTAGTTSNSDNEYEYVLLGREKFLSWLGVEGCHEFEWYLRHRLDTFTMMEFAVWTGRYHVVGALLLGGINPCVRGRALPSPEAETDDIDDIETDRTLRDLEIVGSRLVLPKFFGGVPLSLSSYTVKRAVEMRGHHRQWQIFPNNTSGSAVGNEDPASSVELEGVCSNPPGRNLECALCHQRRPRTALLQYWRVHPSTGPDECRHTFCELCFWKDLVQSLDDRLGDVVVCPVCQASDGSTQLPPSHLCTVTPHGSPLERRFESLERFRDLPATAVELKNRGTRRKRQVRPPIASTWSDAVSPSLGLTQDVRRDRLWRNVESGSIHYVRAALRLGVDVTEPNQYGQTPLYVAAWRGDARLVELLLEYHDGRDLERLPPANGGLTVLGVAHANHHTEIVRLLLDRGAPDAALPGMNPLTDAPDDASSSSILEVLVDPSFDHPGAGSYVIDHCISPSAVDSLCRLWAALPIEVAVKPKTGPCSERRYFCDAERRVAATILPSLQRWLACPAEDGESGTATTPAVFPHLRFLCYDTEGVALLPHVDLPRVDLLTQERSTHTLLLYLSDCAFGGATSLLECATGPGRETVLARVQPQRGRLLLFPHECPHEGEAVVDVPKLLLRGEARLPPLRKHMQNNGTTRVLN